MLDFLSLGVLAMIEGGYAEDGTRVGGTNLVIGFELWSPLGVGKVLRAPRMAICAVLSPVMGD